ncbi:hypothetical protein [Spirosoma sp. KNUC1025]|uniref:hypothetical protein n=1 Tax=Spirosoma sp. KNUC1025 TaxID=2894082 RepID=UPI00386B72CB|nr:hypothetical protein LN737_19050 [Spirosoma sp. KNUC1025]
MEIITLPADEVRALLSEFKNTVAELIAAKRELETYKNDKYVGWDWVCQYLDVERKAARMMLQNEKILVYGRKIKKFRRSDIIRFAERHQVKVKDIPA